MTMQAVVFLALIATVYCQAWDYSKQGQKLWGNSYPMCAGKEQKDRTYINMQSPIDIPNSKKKMDMDKMNIFKKGKYLPDLDVALINSIQDVTLTNNGHFLTITGINSANKLTHGGLVQNDYYLDHIDIHWPAEHKIGGKKYKGEFQLMFKKLSTASAVGTEYVGIVTFFNKGKKAKSPAMVNLLAALPQVVTASSAVTLRDFDVSEFILKRTLKKYHTYQGLTTYPPCDHQVTWIVSDDKKLHVSNSQYKLFEAIYKDNNRKTEKIGARTVFNSFDNSDGGGSAIEDLMGGGQSKDPMAQMMSQLGR